MLFSWLVVPLPTSWMVPVPDCAVQVTLWKYVFCHTVPAWG